jgi:ribose 5-phosphate isomerase
VEQGTLIPVGTGNTEELVRTAVATGTPDRVLEVTTMAAIRKLSQTDREARDNKARVEEVERTAAVDSTPDDSSPVHRANPRLPDVEGI